MHSGSPRRNLNGWPPMIALLATLLSVFLPLDMSPITGQGLLSPPGLADSLK